MPSAARRTSPPPRLPGASAHSSRLGSLSIEVETITASLQQAEPTSLDAKKSRLEGGQGGSREKAHANAC